MLSYPVEAFGKPLAQALRETPQPQGTEVLVRISACGVCHSDVHLFDGYFDLGGGAKVDMGRAMNLPRVLGHEIAGTVVAVGPDAKGVKVGDRRVVFPWVGCGQCKLCQAGNEHLCNAPRAHGIHRDGGFADHVVVPHPRVLLEFDPLPDDQAATLACSGLTAYGALAKVKSLVGPADPLMIIGAGGVGLSGIRLDKQVLGIAPIVAELDHGKWDIAREAGAGECIDPTADGAGKALVKATGGGVAAVIDFVGAGSTFSFGAGVLRRGGKLVSVGLFGGNTTLAPATLALKSLTFEGSYVGSLQEMRDLLAIARAGKLPGMPLASLPLAEANEALAELKAGHVRGRVILRP
jgi:alcohol dehydrogenase/propanol-preferring alcohol dehydrogenase